MHILAQMLHVLNSISPQAWSVIITTVVSAVTVSPLMVGVRKWFSINGEKLMVLLVMLASLASAAISYVMHIPQFAPWIILVQGWLTFATTQPVYFYGVKPLFSAISAWFEGKVAAAAAASNEAKAAAVPAGGVPLDTHDDFSGR